MLLRGLRDRLSTYGGIITPTTRTIILDKGEGARPNTQVGSNSDENVDKFHRKARNKF